MRIVRPRTYKERERKHGKVYERERVVLKVNLPLEYKNKEIVIMTKEEYEKIVPGELRKIREVLEEMRETFKKVKDNEEKVDLGFYGLFYINALMEKVIHDTIKSDDELYKLFDSSSKAFMSKPYEDVVRERLEFYEKKYNEIKEKLLGK